MSGKGRATAVTWVMCALLGARSAAAQGPRTEKAQVAELDARIAALDAYLEDLERPSKVYYLSWVIGLSALCVAQTTYASFEDDRATRGTVITGAVLSGSGAIILAVTPSHTRWAVRAYRALPQGSAAEKRAKISRGQSWLRGEAHLAQRGRSWGAHAAAAAVGLALGLGLGFGYDSVWNGVRSGVGAFGLTELRIWTRPQRARDYVRRYRENPSLLPSFSSLPSGGAGLLGLSLRGRF